MDPTANSSPVLISASSPKQILDLNYSFATTYMLITAVKLHLFSRMEGGAETVSDIATATGATANGIRRLLDGLWTLGLVGRTDDTYHLSPGAAQFLVEGKPQYLGEDTLAMADLMRPWANLASAVQDGTRQSRLDNPDYAEAYYSEKAAGLFPLTYPLAHGLAESLASAKGGLPKRVLDVGAGAAPWSVAVTELDPRVTAVVNDLPAVVEAARSIVQARGLEKQFRFLPGDFDQVDFGQEQYDLIFLCHVCRFIGEERSRKLLDRLHAALTPGGRIVLADILLDTERTKPHFGLVLSLSMLVNTQQGDIYTEEQYRNWLSAAGFGEIERVSVGGPTPLLIAERPKED